MKIGVLTYTSLKAATLRIVGLARMILAIDGYIRWLAERF
jgi:hypothetical protein